MRKPANKTYTFMMTEDDSPVTAMIMQRAGWEGLSICELLNMFRLFLLQIGWTEDQVKSIQDMDAVFDENERMIIRFDHLA